MGSDSDKLVQATRELLKQFGYFVDNLWHIDDVHFMCEQLQLPKITNDEAMHIFEIASQQFDGDVGISWPQLERALRFYLRQQLTAEHPEIIPSDEEA